MLGHENPQVRYCLQYQPHWAGKEVQSAGEIRFVPGQSAEKKWCKCIIFQLITLFVAISGGWPTCVSINVHPVGGAGGADGGGRTVVLLPFTE